MNKYKIYISFILIFVLVIIPIKHTYCADKYDIFLKEPPQNRKIEYEEERLATEFVDKNAITFLKIANKMEKEGITDIRDFKTTDELELKVKNAYLYVYYYSEQPTFDIITFTKEPPKDRKITDGEARLATEFVNNNEKTYNDIKNRMEKEGITNIEDWKTTNELELRVKNACLYVYYYSQQSSLDISAKDSCYQFLQQKRFDFLENPPGKTVTENDYNNANDFYNYSGFKEYELEKESEILSNKRKNAKLYIDQYKKQQEEKEKEKDTYKTNISTDITDGNFIKQFSLDDKNNNNGPIEPILSLIQYVTNIVLGIIQVFSGFLMVVTIAYTGFKMILSTDADNNGGLAANLGFDDLGNSSPAGKKRLQEFMQHLMIGTVITFTSTTIARAIFNILTKF